MLYPSHTVNGVSLTDPGGRWYEAPNSAVIGSFPGARNTTVQMPGVAGVVARSPAPHEASIVTLSVVINAVDANGKLVDGVGLRSAAINRHLDALLLATGIGASTAVGAVLNIVRHHSPTENRTAVVSAGASFTPNYLSGADRAEVTLIFNNPSGLWRSDWISSLGIDAGTTVQLPSIDGSTATIQDCMVAITGPATNPTVTNESGNGFRLAMTIPATRTVVVNTRLWSYGETLSGAPQWGDPQINRSAMKPIGTVSGRALTLIPRPGGGTVSFTCSGQTSATKAVVRAKKAWY